METVIVWTRMENSGRQFTVGLFTVTSDIVAFFPVFFGSRPTALNQAFRLAQNSRSGRVFCENPPDVFCFPSGQYRKGSGT